MIQYKNKITERKWGDKTTYEEVFLNGEIIPHTIFVTYTPYSMATAGKTESYLYVKGDFTGLDTENAECKEGYTTFYPFKTDNAGEAILQQIAEHYQQQQPTVKDKIERITSRTYKTEEDAKQFIGKYFAPIEVKIIPDICYDIKVQETIFSPGYALYGFSIRQKYADFETPVFIVIKQVHEALGFRYLSTIPEGIDICPSLLPN